MSAKLPASLLVEIERLLRDRRLTEIEQLLRGALRRHRDDPHLNLLLGMVVLRSYDWDRARPYLTLARQFAAQDPYVLNQVALFELMLGEPWALDRAREAVKRTAAGEPKPAPPDDWPSDLARDLRSALMEDPSVARKLAEPFVASLQADNRALDAFVDEVIENGLEWGSELADFRSQLTAMKRLNRTLKT